MEEDVEYGLGMMLNVAVFTRWIVKETLIFFQLLDRWSSTRNLSQLVFYDNLVN